MHDAEHESPRPNSVSCSSSKGNISANAPVPEIDISPASAIAAKNKEGIDSGTENNLIDPANPLAKVLSAKIYEATNGEFAPGHDHNHEANLEGNSIFKSNDHGRSSGPIEPNMSGLKHVHRPQALYLKDSFEPSARTSWQDGSEYRPDTNSAELNGQNFLRRPSSSRALSPQVQGDQSLDPQPSKCLIPSNSAFSIEPSATETKAVHEEKGVHEGGIIAKAQLAKATLSKAPQPIEPLSSFHLSKPTSAEYPTDKSESQMTEEKPAKFKEKSIIRRHSSSGDLSPQVQRDLSSDLQPSRGFIPSNPESSIHPSSAETKAVTDEKGVEKKAFHEERESQEEKGGHEGKIIARAPLAEASLAEALQPTKPFSESHLSKLTSGKYHPDESESQMEEAKYAKFREKSIIQRHSSSRALSAQVQRDLSSDQQPSNPVSSIESSSTETKAVHEERGVHKDGIIAKAQLAEASLSKAPQPREPLSMFHLSKPTSGEYPSDKSESQMTEAKSGKFREKNIIMRHSLSRALSPQFQRYQSSNPQPSNGFIPSNPASSIHASYAETEAFHEKKGGHEEKDGHEGGIIAKFPLENAYIFKAPLPREPFSESHLSKLISGKYHPNESESQMAEAKSAKFSGKSIIQRHSSSRALSAQVQRDQSFDPQPSNGFIPSDPASSIHPLSAETKAVPEEKEVEKKAFHEEKAGHEEKGGHEGKIIAKAPLQNAHLFRESLSLPHQSKSLQIESSQSDASLAKVRSDAVISWSSKKTDYARANEFKMKVFGSRTAGISRSKPRVLHSKSSPGKDQIELEDAAPKYAAIEKSGSEMRIPAANSALSVLPGRVSEIEPQQTRIIGMSPLRYAGQTECQESLEDGRESGIRGGRIKVTIGRVDVRPDLPPSSQEMRQGAMPSDRSAPRLSLDGYLRQRNEGKL